jgi:hypothetical protein
VIWRLFYVAAAVWFACWDLKMLFVAATRGYVMALSDPFFDTVESRQPRTEKPQKFWANVVVGLLLLPVAIGAVYVTGSDLWNALQRQGH